LKVSYTVQVVAKWIVIISDKIKFQTSRYQSPDHMASSTYSLRMCVNQARHKLRMFC